MKKTQPSKAIENTSNLTISKSAHSAEDLWKSDPEIIRQFLNVRHEYEQLCAEVEYILKKKITHNKVETSFIGSRAKTLNSFVEKLQRKSYGNPLNELTDLAGARVVCLYSSDLAVVAEIIRNEFTIIEEINKLAEFDPNQFGYSAMHFIVKLGKTSSGARYDDLRNYACEIQVRTVVQDAWAIIQHHMAYKKESQIPSQLHRKLNSLAGLFETVDDQFNSIRSQRDSYLLSIRESANTQKDFLENELNYDSLLEYLKWAFPDRNPGEAGAAIVLDALKTLNYKSLRNVNDALEATKEEREQVMSEMMIHIPEKRMPMDANFEIAIAVSILDEQGMDAIPWGPTWQEVLKRYQRYKTPK
ncbi:GTP pyrophosphokinase [Pseudomonas sp. CF10PS3]